MVTPEGTGYSRWGELAVTRWHEDAALDQAGTFLYLRDDEAGSAGWSVTARPTRPGNTRFDAEIAQFSRCEADICTVIHVAVAMRDDIELRRLRVSNGSARRRTLSSTSFAEIVLAPAATDSAHPAFSKLFVETEIDARLQAILATRRPSTPDDQTAWFFHAAVVHGMSSEASFETDRMRFIGRGRDASNPLALEPQEQLSGSAGSVLDAIAAIRVPIVLDAGASCTIDWFTGIAPSRPECVALALACRTAGAGDRMLAESGTYREATRLRIGASAAEARVYELLAGRVVYACADSRADASDIAANRRGQSDLWGFGLSGDVPVVLLTVANADPLDIVWQWVRAHAFWSAHGVASELMIVTAADCTQGASSALERVRRMIGDSAGGDVLNKPGGIFLRDDATLDDGDRTLLKSVARIAADSHIGPAAQLERTDHRALAWQERDRGEALLPSPAPVPCHIADDVVRSPAAVEDADLVAFNGYGGFSKDLREYVITVSADRMTPLPWTHVIANPVFGTLISESGSAATWSENAQEFRLTPWSNDPVSDANTEAFYIRDEATGRFWSPTLLPTHSASPYLIRHGFGYSVFEHAEDGIESRLCVFVAIDAPVKFSLLTLRNRSGEPRRLSVTGCLDWVLGDERSKTQMQIVTELDEQTGALFARNSYNTDFAGRVAFLDVDGAERSACGDRGDFFGPGGTLTAPAAMARERLSGRLGAALDPCGALRVSIDIPAGEERSLVFRLGAGKSEEEARGLVRRWRGADAARAALDAVHAHWHRTLGVVHVQTPQPSVDALVNGWLLYQVLASRLWGRTAFYQSSGAYGFRDQLQDVMALVHARPELVREHLRRAASRQFAEGDVQHWWHPPSGKGIRTRCSDDYLWLPLVTSRYIEVTGDDSVLDEACPFLESRPLKEGEASDYALPQVSQEQASLYEHCRCAIHHGLRYGAHGLPLMGTGDWNDGMNLVGAAGRGESVWLAFFLVTVLKRFEPIARRRSDTAFADVCASEAAGLGERVDATAWDGDWYRRAWFDDGTPLGSAANVECRIDSIAQSWSVLSGAAPPGRARTAMASLHRHLVHADTGIVQLLTPPFDTSKPSPGYIQGYVPGVRENGGQYTHAAIWAALAFAELGDADRAWQLFRLLDPVRHGSSAAAIDIYKVEPYVVAGDVYAFAPHAGRGGWTWYTGSAGWMYQLLVESLLGLRRCGNQLLLRPLLPADWDAFDMRYRFGESIYEIVCRRARSADGAQVTVDGVVSRDGAIALQGDGKTCSVIVDVWRDTRSSPA